MYKLIFLFFCSSLFSANIGFYSREKYPYSNCVMGVNDLIKSLQKKGHTATLEYDLSKLNDFDVIISIFDEIPRRYQSKSILFILEPEVVAKNLYNIPNLMNYHKIYHFNHDLASSSDKFEKMFFCRIFTQYDHIQKHFVPFKNRKFACLINSILKSRNAKQLYSKRFFVAKYYNKKHPSMLTVHGGRGWENKNLEVYHGKCKSKNEVLRNHRFSYCYENWDNDIHYISEKILDCLYNKCVPIYLGSSRITDYIPKETFIDARMFSSTKQIHDYIAQMDEKTWQGYIDAIDAFNKSDAGRVFSKEAYKERVLLAIDQFLEEKGIL